MYIWDSPRRIFISWELLSCSCLKVNFDGNVSDGRGGAGFVLHGLETRFIAAGSVRLMETSILGVDELRTAWEGICFVTLILRADWLLVGGDSATVVAWLLGARTVVGLVTPHCARYPFFAIWVCCF